MFIATALAAIVVTRDAGGLALVWPADAVAAALLIRRAHVRWLSAGAALFAAAMGVNLLGAHESPSFASALAGINLAEIGAMVWCFRAKIRFPYPAITINQAAIMTALFGIVIPGGAALLGGWLMHAQWDQPFSDAATQWWCSDAVGACLFGPPIILASRRGTQKLFAGVFALQNVAMCLVCLLTCYLAIRYVRFPFVVAGVPLMVVAFRLGGFGASVLSLSTGLTIIGLWMCGIRPFGLETTHLVFSVTGLPVVALLTTVMPPIAVGLGTDARRSAVRALRFSERRFRESMEHSPIGMLITDLEGVWTYANGALQQMLGYTQDELRAFPPGGPSNPHDREAIDGRWQKLKTREIDSYQVDRRFLHKNGASVWAHVTLSLVRDEDGSPRHFMAQIESLDARRRAEEHLAQERERLKITLLAITDAVITTDASTRITYINAAAVSLLGLELKDIEHRRLDEVISLTDPANLHAAANLVGQSIIHGRVFRRETPSVLHRSDGTVCYVTDVVSPVIDANGVVNGVVLVLHDATADMERARDLKHRASHDAITGLANRFAFQTGLEQVFGRAAHMDGRSALMAIDLDRFKEVNDSGGHAAGDAVLQRVSEVLSASVRQSDRIARVGGDEFALILENCTPARIEMIGSQILQALNPLATAWAGTTYLTGASIGVCIIGPAFKNPGEWLAAADAACYEAKRLGRGRLVYAPAALASRYA